ncbi:MAG: hypothetical protein VX460_12065 [Planctomycetota bacterium]|nr:hypothetical protein [Planctomycetota bacterium]
MPSSSSPEPAPEQPTLPGEWLDHVVEGPIPASGEDAAREALMRARGHARALSSLMARGAPDELTGLVVASLNAGAREARALEFARSLPHLKAPAILDEAVAARIDAGATGAPAVLDRLVEERLGAPAQAMTRSMTGRLGRHEAPVELERRVRHELLAGRGAPRSAWRRLASTVGASLLAVVLVVAAQRMLPSGPSVAEPAAERVVSLTVERVTAGELTPSDRAVLGMLGGSL